MDKRPPLPRREILARLVASTALLGASSLVAGCGGGSNDGESPGGTPPTPAPGPSAPPPSAASSPWAYVTSDSNSVAQNGISVLQLDASGAPPRLVNLVPLGVPRGICIAPDSRFLYVSNGDDDTIAIFSVDPATGSLAPAQTPSVANGSTPGAMALRPSGDLLVVASQNTEELSVYRCDASSGLPSKVHAVSSPIGALPSGLAMHPSGKFIYVSSELGRRMDAYSIDADGKLTLASSVQGFEGSPGVPFVEPSGRFLLFSYFESDHIHVIPIDVATGSMIQAEKTVVQTPPMRSCVRFAFNAGLPGCLYASIGGEEVAECRFDLTNGTLDILRWHSVASSAITSLAIDATGTALYGCDSTAGSLHSFSCDAATGALTYRGNLALDSPQEIVLANV